MGEGQNRQTYLLSPGDQKDIHKHWPDAIFVTIDYLIILFLRLNSYAQELHLIDSMRPPFLEQHLVSQEDLATIACYGNLKRLCSTCNKSITVKGIISRTILPACDKISLAVEQELAIAVWIKR